MAVLAAFAACVAFMVYAGQRIYGTMGPSRAFAAADGRLYVLSHGRIHVFAENGRRIEAIDLAALGVHPRPSDFEVHRDGRIVTTDPNNPVLYRCRPPAGPCETIQIDIKSLPAQELLRLNAAKIHIDDDAARYYISDNSGHSVVIADFTGRVLARTRPGMMRYPNQLSVRAPGTLTVADTNHQRLVTLQVADDRFGRTIGNMSTDADDVTRPGREWPFDSVRLPDGATWVLLARNGMKDADVISFDAGGKARRRIDMGEDADPFDIEVWRGRVWVADGTRYRLDSVSFDVPPQFGEMEDASFREELQSEHRRVQAWKAARLASQVGMILIPLLGILIIRRT